MNLCQNEPFYEQPIGAFCSGSLVGPDLMMTAGHCIRSQSSCETTTFVFGYGVEEQGQYPTKAKSSDVYRCKTLIQRMEIGDGADFALVKVDRVVTDRNPLPINRSANISNGTPLVVIGHPSGLPTKISDGANVRAADRNGFFVANLDTYGGNSGSAVFNTLTGLVEGILVRGEQDFVYRGGCAVSNRCASDGCRGEDVTKITELSKYIP
jgi:V8-like Glu-specific endopeptidase